MTMHRAGEVPMTVLLVSLALIFGLGLSHPGNANAEAPPQTERAPQYIYERTCGYCHGHNVAPIIRGRGLPPQTIEYFVRNGQGAMPAFKPTEITPEELKALARWISTSAADPKEHGQ